MKKYIIISFMALFALFSTNSLYAKAELKKQAPKDLKKAKGNLVQTSKEIKETPDKFK